VTRGRSDVHDASLTRRVAQEEQPR
jgi:hypothetical protein